ncbi:MAG: M6 family metalloprotease domain-containing protein [Thermoplasmata archaeon]|nr:M6 family metalloprotease domain-containing protein [Thermoplasmata archaeon]
MRLILYLLTAFLMFYPSYAVNATTPEANTTAPDVAHTEKTSAAETRAGERNPVRGTLKVLVIAIEFSDLNHTASLSTFEGRISGMNSYYQEVSYGNVSITGDVAPKWYRSSHTLAYYGADSGGGTDNANVPIYYLVMEAINLADPDINYRDYDTDGDGKLDHLIVVHAGQDQATSGNSNDIWSHRGEVRAYKDGVSINSYVLVSEFSPVSVFCHEFGHDLLLPDLYDYGYDSDGLGVWSLMAAGTIYGNSPAHFDPWCKYYLGWIDPIVVNDNMKQVVIPPVERYPVVYKLKISDTEYFLIENRQKISYDRYLPGKGLMIYHVDEKMWSPDVNNIKHWKPNEDENHKFIDVEESTPRQDLDIGYTEGDYNQGDSTDPWLNSEEGFWFGSNPNSTSYYTPWKDSEIAVKNIHPSGENMIADLIIQKREITLSPLTQLDVQVKPGSEYSFRFRVTSNRLIGDNITVDIRGNHLDWLLPYTTIFNLSGPGDSRVITVTVVIPRMTLAGYSGRFTIKVISSDGTTSAPLYFNVTVSKLSSLSAYTEPSLNFSEPGSKSIWISILSMSNFDEEVLLSYQLTGDSPDSFRISSIPESVRISPFSWYNFTATITLLDDVEGGSETTLKITITSSQTSFTNYTTVLLRILERRVLKVEIITSTPVVVSPGDEGVLEFQIRNTGNTEDRVVVLPRPPSGWTSSVNPSGKFYIPAGGTKRVVLTFNVPQDTLYRESGYVFNVSVSGESSISFNFTVQVRRFVTISADSTPDVARVKPFESGNISISVRNMGNTEVNLAIHVYGVTNGITVKSEKNIIHLGAGETGVFNITASVEKMLSEGDYPFTVEISSSEFYVKTYLNLTVEVLNVVRITFSDVPKSVSVGDIASFWVNNDGNGDTTLILSYKLPQGLRISFYDQSNNPITFVTVQRGGRVLVLFKVEAEGMETGQYNGNITLSTPDGTTYTLPLQIEVKAHKKSEEGASSNLLYAAIIGPSLVALLLFSLIFFKRRKETQESPPDKGNNLVNLLTELNRRIDNGEGDMWTRIHRDAAVEAMNRGETEKALEEINEAFKSLHK